MREELVPTADGRELMVLEVGDPSGYPVLHNHGTPSSRREVAHHDDAFASAGLRVIAPDRPGYGRSTPRRGATVTDWADDVRVLVDHLGLETFGVVGYSAGGAFACSVAFAMPDRVDQLGLVAAEHPGVLGEFDADAIYVEAARRLDPVAFEEFFPTVTAAELPQVELDTLTDPAETEILVSMVVEGMAQGPIGHASYFWTVSQPWGFEIGEVATGALLWQGERDGLVPVRSAELYERDLPHAELTVLPNETHLTIWRRAPELYARTFSPR